MNKQFKVLFAEDEMALGTIVKESLESRGFEVDHCTDGGVVMEQYQAAQYDIILLDVMMPHQDGFSLAKSIRKLNPAIPIIFITAKSRPEDVVEGFGHGANDYIRKPFSMEELIVRMHALMKRGTQASSEEVAQIGKYTFNKKEQLLSLHDESISLTYKESELLSILLTNKNQLTDRSLILEKIWGHDDFFNARSMDVFISKLRKKLAKDESIKILNQRGYGYTLIC